MFPKSSPGFVMYTSNFNADFFNSLTVTAINFGADWNTNSQYHNGKRNLEIDPGLF